MEQGGGAVVVSNLTIRVLEERERLRIERLRAVCERLRGRDLETFPQVQLWPDEWKTLVIYRPELTTVRLGAVGKNRDSLLFVLDALNKPTAAQHAVSTHAFRRSLLALTAGAQRPPAGARRLRIA
ncbi:hypothetical protein [Streptomyces capparidis]